MFLSKNAKLVKRFKTPVHQVDIAPTVAAILGIHGKTAWLGHNVMPSDLKTPPVPGSPLVYGNGYLTSYRYGNHVCHSSELNPRLTCVDLRDDEDLMFSTTAKAVKERPEWTSFFKKVVQSNSEVILYDLIMDNNRP